MGREKIREFLTRKWQKELDYKLKVVRTSPVANQWRAMQCTAGIMSVTFLNVWVLTAENAVLL